MSAPMPRKKKTQKKKSGIVSRYSVSTPPGRLLSPQTGVKLIYHTSGQLNPGIGGTTANNIFRLSSIFDPDFTGIGHQPLGRDQLAVLYERYQVWKVDFHIVYVNTDGSNVQRCGYTVSDDSTTAASGEIYIEQGNSEWDILGIAGGQSKKVFSGSVKLNECHGISYKQYMANDDYGAKFGSNPTEECFLKCWVDGVGTDTSPVRFSISLVFHTKIMGSVTTTQS